MFFSKVACAVALSSAVYASPAVIDERANNNGGGNAAAASSSGGLTLSASAVQTGSQNDGRNEIGGAEVGQALSAVSDNNFINQCAGKTLTNGLQITTGSCNGIVMGDIPAKTAMVSSTITFPKTGSTIQSNTDFNITVQMANLVAGSFTNADSTYYAAPQTLQGGQVVGHTHVVVQDMGSSLNPTQPLDATQFAFFKGINDAGNGKGLLSAAVTGGLPAGNYRLCTMASASNHQPVLMPVAQRGPADDCTKFVVVGSGNTENAAANDGSGGIAAAAAAASAVAAGPDNTAPPVASSAAASTSAAGKGGKGGNGNAAQTSAAAAASSSAAAKGGNAKGGKGNAAASSAAAAATTSAAAAKGGNGGNNAAAAASTTSAAAASKNTGAAQGNGGFGQGGQAQGQGGQGGRGGFNKNGRRSRFLSREFIV